MIAGTKHSEETLKLISSARQGKALGNRNAAGHKRSEAFKKHLSQTMSGKNSPHWRDDVGYRGIHLWINKVHGKARICELADESCSSVYHWSNKSGQYLRDENDWQQLCVSHHKRFDLRSST